MRAPLLAGSALMMSTLEFCLAASTEPRAVAAAALTAWRERDAAALLPIAHPQLKERVRGAAILGARRPGSGSRDKLLAIVHDRAREADTVTALPPAASDADAFALFCQALNDAHPRSDRFSYTDQWMRTIPAGEHVIVRFVSNSKKKTDPGDVTKWENEVVVKKDQGRWLFLWCPEMLGVVSSEWNPRPRTTTVRVASDGHTSVRISDVAHVFFSGPRRNEVEFELGSGFHEIVGSRAGYRASKSILYVSPDLPPIRVWVACTEKL